MSGRSQKTEVRSQKGGASRWAVAVVLLVTLAAMGRLTAMDFAWWDDDKVLIHNPRMNPSGWDTVGYYWTHESMGLYVPVAYTVWAGLAAAARVEPDVRGVALNPWVFHAFNVGLHLVNVGLVYVILKRVVRAPWAAAAGAMVFGVHPVQVETVGWVAGMKDLLCGTFVLLAVWQYLLFAEARRDGEKGAWAHYWVGLACVVLGMLSKPTAVVTPVLVAVLDVWVVGRGWKTVLRDVWPWGVAVLPCLGWAKAVQTVSPRGPLWSRPLVATDAVAFYLGKLVWPARLAIDYGRNPAYVIATGQLWWTWVAPAAAAVALWLGRKRVPVLVGAALVFVGGMLPVLGLTPFMYQIASTTADHYLYLPILGVALAAAWVMARWPTRGVGVAAGVVIAALAVRSAAQAGVWADDVTMYRHAVSVTPGSEAMRVNYAAALQLQAEREGSTEEMDESIRQLREALRINPDSVSANENLAALMIQRGQVDEGIRRLQTAAAAADRASEEQEPREKRGPTHRLLGMVLAQRGRYAEAVTEFEKALDYMPGDAKVLAALDEALRKVREPSAASRPATTKAVRSGSVSDG